MVRTARATMCCLGAVQTRQTRVYVPLSVPRLCILVSNLLHTASLALRLCLSIHFFRRALGLSTSEAAHALDRTGHIGVFPMRRLSRAGALEAELHESATHVLLGASRGSLHRHQS